MKRNKLFEITYTAFFHYKKKIVIENVKIKEGSLGNMLIFLYC